VNDAKGDNGMGDGVRRQPDKLVHEEIVNAAARHPERAALVAGDDVLTYGELLDNAKSIAYALRSAGVGNGVSVASCLPRCLALGPAVLGTWLAGGTYVPLAADGPPVRQEHILRDSATAVVISTAETAIQSGDNVAQVIVDTAGATTEQGCHPEVLVGGRDLAYIIYTSGSTGRPKGVLVEHGQLAAMARSHEITLYGGQGREITRVALNNVTTADSFFSDFVHLAYGRTLYVVTDETRRAPDRLADFICDHGIEVLDGTPTQLEALALAGRGGSLSKLSVLVVGGEATSSELWRYLSALPNVSPYNLYGPTECTVAVTAAAFHDHAEPRLGSPLPGCAVWVVDDDLQLVPDGRTGELLITGDQVARGYLHPVPEDAARFVDWRLPDGTAVRGYRSGDRVRRDDSGELEFLGRADSQVSIGGFRVELGEVEAALRTCSGVRAAAVSQRRRDQRSSLVAYAVLDGGAQVEAVRNALTSILPTYMIPALTVVPEIPMGPTGKADFSRIDRAHSQDPQPHREIAETADSGAIADTVRRIWRETLGVHSVRAADDFFSLGGDSVKATSVAVAVREVLAPDMPIRVIFEHPTFEAFCTALLPYLADI
jgi:amino acid adenylation domain-containing protein